VTDALAQERRRDIGELLIRCLPQRAQRFSLEGVEFMWSAILKRKIRDVPISDIRLRFADNATELLRRSSQTASGNPANRTTRNSAIAIFRDRKLTECRSFILAIPSPLESFSAD
jgi:hypothetical protein